MTQASASAAPGACKSLMGHATIAMTFDTYGHLMPDGLEQAAAAANRYLATG